MSTILPNQVHTFLVCIVWFLPSTFSINKAEAACFKLGTLSRVKKAYRVR